MGAGGGPTPQPTPTQQYAILPLSSSLRASNASYSQSLPFTNLAGSFATANGGTRPLRGAGGSHLNPIIRAPGDNGGIDANATWLDNETSSVLVSSDGEYTLLFTELGTYADPTTAPGTDTCTRAAQSARSLIYFIKNSGSGGGGHGAGPVGMIGTSVAAAPAPGAEPVVGGFTYTDGTNVSLLADNGLGWKVEQCWAQTNNITGGANGAIANFITVNEGAADAFVGGGLTLQTLYFYVNKNNQLVATLTQPTVDVNDDTDAKPRAKLFGAAVRALNDASGGYPLQAGFGGEFGAADEKTLTAQAASSAAIAGDKMEVFENPGQQIWKYEDSGVITSEGALVGLQNPFGNIGVRPYMSSDLIPNVGDKRAASLDMESRQQLETGPAPDDANISNMGVIVTVIAETNGVTADTKTAFTVVNVATILMPELPDPDPQTAQAFIPRTTISTMRLGIVTEGPSFSEADEDKTYTVDKDAATVDALRIANENAHTTFTGDASGGFTSESDILSMVAGYVTGDPADTPPGFNQAIGA
jgi:hypothetical protein